MRKLTFLFSAVVMAASLTGCGNTTSTTPDTPSSQAVTAAASSEAESQSDEVVEIDPFANLDFVYHHDYDGNIVEKNDSTNLYISPITELHIYGDFRNVQLVTNTEEQQQCKELGFDFDIYREIIPNNSQDGDMIKYGIAFDGYDTESELHDYVKEQYNIELVNMSEEIPLHFEEEPIEDCDPFEGVTFEYKSSDMGGTPYVWYETNLTECDGNLKAHNHHCELGYESINPDGKDEDSLADGDTIKLIVTYRPENEDTVYKGEEAKKKIEEYQWYRLNLTRTEYEFTIDLSNNNSSSAEE